MLPPSRGAAWLLADAASSDVFTPESMSEEHRLIQQATEEFVAQEVAPALDKLEAKDWALARSLIQRCGALGLLGSDVPEALGGVGLDKASSVIIGEAVGAAASFAAVFGAQTGLAIIPILCFGTEEQKARYLPRLVSGEILGAYCLSESGSGSDALGARAKATRQPDGSWRLNGEKMWVTNGGFADVFIVFAKVDGEQFSAFIVERGFPGVSSGAEEHKLGLHGSSTTPVLLQDAQIPADNLLGEVGRGHKIAFNVLNYGRFKLAGMCSGGAKRTIAEAAGYATTRRQFGQPISSFGAIRHKLAEMTIRAFAVESMLYRTAGAIDAAIAAGMDRVAAFEEYAIESSILKVSASEMVDFVVDENVQIHGGNGFVRDYPAERHFRDARVNRIFEGTNEINRLLVPGMIAKRALKGDLALIPAAKALQDRILTPAAAGMTTDSSLMAGARATVSGLRQVAVMILGLAMQTYGDKLQHEQEVLMLASDIVADTFAADSALLRAESQIPRGAAAAAYQDAAAVFIHDAGLRTEHHARVALAAMASGDNQTTMLAALRRLLKVTPVDTVAARRRLADAIVERKGYVFNA